MLRDFALRSAPLVLFLAACSTANGNAGSAAESASGRAAPVARVDTPRAAEPVLRADSPVAAVTGTDTLTGEPARIARLEREARAIAKVTGCTSASACRTAPVGARACGGPRTFVVYCAATTDTVALMRKLRELERVEKAWLERSGMASTCEMRMAPQTTLVGGSCREVKGGVGMERLP